MIIFAYSPIGLNQKLVEIRVPSATGPAGTKNIKHDYKCITQTWGEREINATKVCHMRSGAFPLSNLFIQKYESWSGLQTVTVDLKQDSCQVSFYLARGSRHLHEVLASKILVLLSISLY